MKTKLILALIVLGLSGSASASASEGMGVGLLSFALLSLYFLPTMVAAAHKQPNVVGICVLNFFLGWTLVGWVIALVWALKKQEGVRGSSGEMTEGSAATKKCEFCAEEVLAEAIKCKHCGSDISAVAVVRSERAQGTSGAVEDVVEPIQTAKNRFKLDSWT